jgi:hypothetical protein
LGSTKNLLRVAVIVTAVMASANTASAARQVGYVLTTANTLLTIDTDNPGTAIASVPVTGVIAGETLTGIDIRTDNGMLYSLGVNAAADTMTVYLIATRTGVATAVGAGSFTGAGDLPDPAVARYGIDFNPVTDRLRVTTSQSGAGPAVQGLNFRVNVTTGTLVQADSAINPAPIKIDEVAYTDVNRLDTRTSLYTISVEQDSLYIQTSHGNTGTQTQAVPLSQDLLAVHGFDLDDFTHAGSTDGPVIFVGSDAFVVATTAAGTGLVRIKLLTGDVGPLAAIAGGVTNIRGFAVRGLPYAGHFPATALTAIATPTLVRFGTNSHGVTSSFVTGVIAGDKLMGLDLRPATGQMFSLGFNSTNNTAQLYLIEPYVDFITGGATPVGAPIALTLAGATAFGIDFDPTADELRVVTSAGENFRINPASGARTQTGGAIVPGREIVGAAYTNNFGQTVNGAAPTTLYVLDATTNTLAIQNPASGVLSQAVPVTLDGSPLDFISVAAFDIVSTIVTPTANAPAAGKGHAILQVGIETRLYAIDLVSGAATPGLFTQAQGYVGLAVGDSMQVFTTAAIGASAGSSAVNAPVTLTATMVPSEEFNAWPLTGTVAFTRDGVVIPGCEARPVAGGAASCQTSFASAGTIALAAAYTGDWLFFGSTTTALSHTVTPVVVPAPTNITLGISPGHAPVGEDIVLTADVTPGAATGEVTFLVDGVSIGTSTLSAGRATLTTATLPAGSHEVTAVYGGSPTFATSSTAGSVALLVGNFRQHFAEGATGFFQTVIGVLNTSRSKAANVVVRLFPEGAPAVVKSMVLAPLTRQTLDINAILAAENISASVSTLIESDQPIATSRQMTWGTPVYGSTLESGVPDTSTTWYFAEGATNVFSLFYLIENPQSTPAEVTLTHLLEGGAAPVVQTATVDPFARRTFNINEVPGLAQAALSTVISSNVPIVAERAMYISSPARLWDAGSAGAGASALSTTWSLAEGATGFFHTYLLLGNPDTNTAIVTVRYQLPDGTAITRPYEVAGRTRRTIDVGGEDPSLASATVGMTIESTLPIVAERAMWWGLPFYEGSVALGTTSTGTAWGIGEGIEGGSADEATFVLVSNGAALAGTVRCTVVYDDGTHQERDFPLAGTSRVTIRVGTEFPDSAGRKFSVMIESVEPNLPITVEYARYQSSAGFLGAGGAALATRLR